MRGDGRVFAGDESGGLPIPGGVASTEKAAAPQMRRSPGKCCRTASQFRRGTQLRSVISPEDPT